MIQKFKPGPLPRVYKWIEDQATGYGPNLMREALKTYGLKETPGLGNTPEIIAMADTLGGVIADFYTKDSIPWCGLVVSYWILMAGFEPPKNFSQVRARDFAAWGIPADRPSFGDVLVFWRGSPAGRDGHVGLYVAEDDNYYYVLGGNQSDQINIAKLDKNRLLAARRCPWRIRQPDGVQPLRISEVTGAVSVNEA